jgi:hypothetical protein
MTIPFSKPEEVISQFTQNNRTVSYEELANNEYAKIVETISKYPLVDSDGVHVAFTTLRDAFGWVAIKAYLDRTNRPPYAVTPIVMGTYGSNYDILILHVPVPVYGYTETESAAFKKCIDINRTNNTPQACYRVMPSEIVEEIVSRAIPAIESIKNRKSTERFTPL